MRGYSLCAFRGDDRTPTLRQINGRWMLIPPVLRRGTIRRVALLGVCCVVYGTLMPFGMNATTSFALGADGFAWRSPLGVDVWANLLVYIPIGLFLRLAIRRRRARSGRSACIPRVRSKQPHTCK